MTIADTLPPVLDKSQIRRSFDKAAKSYDQFATLQRLIGDRLLERLHYMRIQPRQIADIGAGTGHCARQLEQRYREALILLLDLAPSMLAQAKTTQKRWRSRQRFACSDAEHLALATGAVDIVFSNLTFQWCNDLAATFKECRRVLRQPGLFMFSTLGPDTLKELRQAWSCVDDGPHINVFMDMHDVGDALIQAGFSSPVLDRENVTMTYDDVMTLMRDLKGIGAHNGFATRARGLLGRQQLRGLLAAYEQFRCDTKLPATYEIVYGHAWAPVAGTRPQDGSTVASFPLDQLKRR